MLNGGTIASTSKADDKEKRKDGGRPLLSSRSSSLRLGLNVNARVKEKEKDDSPWLQTGEVPPRASSPGYHPLSADGLFKRKAGSGLDNGLVNGRGKGKEKEDGWSELDGAEKGVEKDVLVHEVQPTDSLARVALLYGIELSILRKANKLWPSDSIHLRKYLYIPLDSRKFTSKSTIPPRTPDEDNTIMEWPFMGNNETTEAGHYSTVTPSSVASSLSDLGRRLESTGSIPGGATIRRVPVSQLSFFPPPSSNAPRPSTESLPSPSTPSFPTESRSHPPRSYSEFSTGSSLLNLFKPLPLPRISIDSVASSATVSEEEVELDVAHSGWARPGRKIRRTVSGKNFVRSEQPQPMKGMEVPKRALEGDGDDENAG